MSATPHQDLRHFVRVYDDALPATWCTRLLAGFDALSAHQARNGRELRAALRGLGVDRAQRHAPRRSADSSGTFASSSTKALARYNADVGLGIPVPNSPACADLVLKRYRPDRPTSDSSCISIPSIIWRIATWCSCGISTMSTTAARHVFPISVSKSHARAGRLLIFPPYWMYPARRPAARVRRQVHPLDLSAVHVRRP